ncbi:succinylarginine dihydrolase [Candidatus Marinamargulisbacteria bacterium SCGC AG-414-C22]|nr:succinylarginine dihydrolase [Candidatus Marinamargulisbacteria bacterium SCGC AG-414-C22]
MYQQCFFDAVIGPTYHFGGLSFGNTHSMSHQQQRSYPKKTALEGLHKMQRVSQLGFKQYVLPPQPRQFLSLLKAFGLVGDSTTEIQQFYHDYPKQFSAIFSASAAWVANAFIATPSCDTASQRVHITPANLVSNDHRKLELCYTTQQLQQLFLDSDFFKVNQAVKQSCPDEGAANMIRLGTLTQGFYLFVYNVSQQDPCHTRFPGRQSKEALSFIVKKHGINADRVCYLQQSFRAVDAGVFHNDVIAFGDQDVLVVHEHAYEDQSRMLGMLQDYYNRFYEKPLTIVEIAEKDLSLATAVTTYFFNSQFVKCPNDSYVLICPDTCKEDASIQRVITLLSAQLQAPLQVTYVSVSESLQNGGGPACLRGFVALTDSERHAMNSVYEFTPQCAEKLISFVQSHYPTTLDCADLCDVGMIQECQDIVNQLQLVFESNKS